MDAHFWHQKWQKNDIGFHKSEINLFLTRYFKRLALAPKSRVFVPLCGKTRDISWLLSNDYRVAGVELSQEAVKQLFASLEIIPNVQRIGDMVQYSAQDIDIFVGDIFTLSQTLLGEIDAIYDRAALVALPDKMRQRYAQQIMTLSKSGPQLLITYEYDQASMDGPPFSIDQDAIDALYAAKYKAIFLDKKEVTVGRKGSAMIKECVWVLEPF